MLQYFQELSIILETISEHSEKKEYELHQFMEGIYKLSSIAAGRMKEETDTNDLEGELEFLRKENERLNREKRRITYRCERNNTSFDSFHYEF